MNIVFVSNYFNHHQRPLCDALSSGCRSFFFIATSQMREERRQLGYAFEEPSYVIRSYEDGQIDRARQLIRDADVVIYGGVSGELAKPKLYRGKTVFYYFERIDKNGSARWKLPVRAARFFRDYRRKQDSYLLCAGAYTAYDFSKTHSFQNRCYRWGYFPETKVYDTRRLMQKKEPNRLLWCGRMIDWKHPELALEVAGQLRDDGYDFTMDMIGAGDMEPELRRMVSKNGLEQHVRLTGAVAPENIRGYMERTGVFMMTSDRKEGWGAVLNEAMNSGCAVVAGSAAGAVPYLIRHGENGLVFQDGSAASLYENVKKLLDDPFLQKAFGMTAYQTIRSCWNAEFAAERLLQAAQSCRAGNGIPERNDDGPLSRAVILGDKDFESDKDNPSQQNH